MARRLRVQYPAAIYHVMNRGDRREPIFKDEPDHLRLLVTLGEACAIPEVGLLRRVPVSDTLLLPRNRVFLPGGEPSRTGGREEIRLLAEHGQHCRR